MTPPLSKAMKNFVDNDPARFHMPGHKGRLEWLDKLAASGNLASYDITEVDGCDKLYEAQSAIAETERLYASLYGSAASLLSAGGSTLCIQTMLALALKPRQKLILGRGCHIAAINAMALLDITPAWVFPDSAPETGLAKAVTAEDIGIALEQNPDAAAVYVTSPDYFGAICDIKAIAGVCRSYGKPLLTDNAHGAHLRFLEPSIHPLNLGADMCCDSLHKTLPVLTGGAILHIGNQKYVADAKRCMSIFGSTSPNYLLLLSIDMALETLRGDFPERLRQAASETARLEKAARDAGFLVPGGMRDPVRLTLGFSAAGYDAGEFIRLLRQNGIEPEMVSKSFAVFMASPHNRQEDFARLEKLIRELPKKSPLTLKSDYRIRPEKAVSLRDAVLTSSVELPVEIAAGRIAGSTVAPCPPGIPLVVPGEVIDEKIIDYLKNYGISRLNVLK